MLVNKAWLLTTLQNPTNEFQCIFRVCKLVSQVEVCSTNDLARLKHEAGLQPFTACALSLLDESEGC